jgi:hypothetical protein
LSHATVRTDTFMTDIPTARCAGRTATREGTDVPTTAASNSVDSTKLGVTVVPGMTLRVVSASAAGWLAAW